MKKFFKILFLVLGILIVLFGGNFFLIKKLDRDVREAVDFYTPTYNTNQATLLPSVFINGARFYLKLPIGDTDTVLAFCDSGGGQSMIMPSTIEEKQLDSKEKIGLFKGVMPLGFVPFKDLVNDETFPPPYPLRHFNLRRPISRVSKPYLLVPPMDDELKFLQESMPELDVFLGQNLFMGKAWTLDYLQQQVWVNTPIAESEISKSNVQRIGFKKNSSGQSIYGHPSMIIEVDGEQIDVLFDTGATMILSKKGKKDFNTDKITLAGSFIAASIFDKWRKEHPEWNYYEKADMKRDIIEVPLVSIGGNEVGPVLFAKRKDENWSEGMIHSMDKVVKGAIGGSALKYLKVTVDYNSELIRFEK